MHLFDKNDIIQEVNDPDSKYQIVDIEYKLESLNPVPNGTKYMNVSVMDADKLYKKYTPIMGGRYYEEKKSISSTQVGGKKRTIRDQMGGKRIKKRTIRYQMGGRRRTIRQTDAKRRTHY